MLVSIVSLHREETFHSEAASSIFQGHAGTNPAGNRLCRAFWPIDQTESDIVASTLHVWLYGNLFETSVVIVVLLFYEVLSAIRKSIS